MQDTDSFQPADDTLLILPTPEDTPLPTEAYRQLIQAPSNNPKRYSLDHDIKMGWVPRTQIAGPIPLAFQNGVLDLVLDREGLANVIYLGWRPANTFELHEKFCGGNSKYPFYQFHLCKSTFLSNFIRKYYPDYNFSNKRPFLGMNPSLKDRLLVFDSDYEGGNLDAVIKKHKDYELYIRVDSNTRGHCNYFCFKVRNKEAGVYRFTLVNLSMKRTLYERGMRPYAKSSKNLKGHWEQVGTNLRYASKEIKGKPNDEGVQTIYSVNCLSFDYQFKLPDDQVQFCYCVPYTYSTLLKDIQDFQTNEQKRHIIHRSRLCFSLSGVQIPVLTITNPSPDQSKKLCIVISGRIHPGESNGSFVMLGLLRYLTSSAAIQLRDKVIFKIVPMLNPDGVILGNHRTGVAGKDLNREFLTSNKVIFPEVIALKDYVTDLKSRFGDRLFAFFDIHGHSMRKNSFVYGPQYPIFQLGYMRSRVLPRLIASKTSMFRYYSCRFMNDTDKQRTARSVFFSTLKIELAYTLESSNYCYFNAETREHVDFNEKSWAKMGRILGEALREMVEIEGEREEYRGKVGEKKGVLPGRRVGDLEVYKSLLEAKLPKDQNAEEVTYDHRKKTRKNAISQNIIRSELVSQASHEKPVSSERRRQQISKSFEQQQFGAWQRDDESDKYSEAGADSQTEDHDLPKTQLKAFHGKIRQNKKNYYDEISKFKFDEESRKTSKIRRHSNLEGNFISVPSERLEDKPSVALPPRLKPETKIVNHIRKRSLRMEDKSLKNVKIQVASQPTIEQVTYYRQSPKKNPEVAKNQLHNSRQYIRIDQQTLQRLIQNTKFGLLLSKPQVTARVQHLPRPERNLQNNILRRKKSIKALHGKAKDRNVYRALQTVFSNTKSLPRIVVLKN